MTHFVEISRESSETLKADSIGLMRWERDSAAFWLDVPHKKKNEQAEKGMESFYSAGTLS